MPSLHGILVGRLLLNLHKEGFSGWLELERGSVSRRFQFQDGTPVLVESSQSRDGLYQLLAGQGKLDETHRAQTEDSRRGKTTELAAIARLRVVSPRDLLRAVREQITHCLVDCCAWIDGRFQLEPGAAPADPAGPQLDLVPLACEAMARHLRPDQVLLAMEERVPQFAVPGPDFDRQCPRVARDSGTRAFLDGIDGSRTAFELVRDAPSASAYAALLALDALDGFAWYDTRIGGDADEDATASEATASGPAIEIVIAGGEAEQAALKAQARTEQATQDDARDAAAQELRKEIVDIHGRLSEINAYDLLGVERDARTIQIKRAYLVLAKRLHPDALARRGLDDIKAQANAVFAEVTRAYALLSNSDERGSYDAALDGHSAVDADRLVQAEELFRKGELMMKAGNFLGAVELLDSAVRLWPEEADYQSALGWTLFKKNPPELERARKHLSKAAELDAGSAKAHHRLSFVLKVLGLADDAADALDRAREIDPSLKG